MKTLILSSILFMAFGGFVRSEAQTVREVKVLIGNTKNIVPKKLSLKFLSLVEDSRCPTDTKCIWAGNAKIKIQLSKPGKPIKTFELNTNPGNTTIFEGYKFKLKALTPHPATNIRINRNGYVATISVIKA
ncbi:MAG: hypothetical protein M3Q26_11540 [Acidobacteriota bacterium]|nr:hypothetical protein [Acidobacteriota bacterium]